MPGNEFLMKGALYFDHKDDRSKFSLIYPLLSYSCQ